MQIANFQNVTSQYGAHVVLQGVSFKINSGQKLGLYRVESQEVV